MFGWSMRVSHDKIILDPFIPPFIPANELTGVTWWIFDVLGGTFPLDSHNRDPSCGVLKENGDKVIAGNIRQTPMSEHHLYPKSNYSGALGSFLTSPWPILLIYTSLNLSQPESRIPRPTVLSLLSVNHYAPPQTCWTHCGYKKKL